MKKSVLFFLFGFICASVIGVGANVIYNAKDISYSNNKTSATNVSDAIDELIDDNSSFLMNLRSDSYSSSIQGFSLIPFSNNILKFKHFKITSMIKNSYVSSCNVFSYSSSSNSQVSLSLNTEYSINNKDALSLQNIYMTVLSNSSSTAICNIGILFYN